MILSIEINYRTHWGEDVRVCGSIPELGGGDLQKAIPLHTRDGESWSLTIEAISPAESFLEYTYFIFCNGKPIQKEWDTFPRRIQLRNTPNRVYHSFDAWRDMPKEQLFYSSAFTQSLTVRTPSFPVVRTYSKSLVIKVFSPRVVNGFCIGILGDHPALGSWNPEKVLLMNDATFPEWRIELDASRLCYPLEYKFVLYNLQDRRILAWEEGSNRRICEPQIRSEETALISDQFVDFPIPIWKGAGVAIPVFSLRSEKSFGIGDFADLKLMIDWAVQTHQKVVQILPIYDTTMTHTWMDSYPYNSISIYALNPVYLSLEKMGTLKNKELQKRFSQKQKKLNALKTVDYEAVEHAKWEYFRLLYAQDGILTLTAPEFKRFFHRNSEWLVAYAAFSYLRDLYHTADFHTWPQYSVYNHAEIEALCTPFSEQYEAIAFYYYLQYHLHRQLSEVTEYAHRKGVVLKGDIPIGISRCSVEAWKEPHYFNLNGQAGAPPDDFSVNGQNWGFPTYNWEAMARDGYTWWLKRFGKMAEYFDAYRIDHILGFFRIWEIPVHAVHGLLGQFSPALPMSVSEIEEYGLSFQENLFTQPYIHENFLEELFGSQMQVVKDIFIEPIGSKDGRYKFRSEYNTQRKIEISFQGKSSSEQLKMRDGLYTLLENVLFLHDHKKPYLYHPRINAQQTYLYQSLSEKERSVFDRIHEDFFYHRHNEFWYRQAMEKLPQLIQSTRMLVCGEDLGMIPSCVPRVMEELQILSLEIQRMPKGWTEFANPAQYPYLSVSSISTHDMSTLRGWWKEDPGATQRFYNIVLGHPGTAPEEANGFICKEIIRQHLEGKSVLCILSLQDWLSMSEKWRCPDIEAERINIPSHPRHYWRYRMHLTLEQLLQADEITRIIRELLAITGRNPRM